MNFQQTKPVAASAATAIQTFFADSDAPEQSAALEHALESAIAGEPFQTLLTTLIGSDAFGQDFGDDFAETGAFDAIAPARMMRGGLNLPLEAVFQLVARMADGVEAADAGAWERFADQVHDSKRFSSMRLRDYLTQRVADTALRADWEQRIADLTETNPHAVYPTSPYRESDGRVVASHDHRSVDAVMSFSTFASIRMVDHVLDEGRNELRDIYRPLGRCIALVDSNIEENYAAKIEAHFARHGIPLEKLVYRAMEADKGLGTVEKMLGDFKKLGLSRNEPVLIIGGGVLADTGGLACALYGRNTPYVMLGTSIVTGIDAGPSPRTCCDGFGYKNLLGAYHPPVLCLTDRYFFASLREGWLRHGIAEIVKMAIVKDMELFENLEAATPNLVETRFGTLDCADDDPIHDLSNAILGAAMRTYVEAEYDNLYETHQCRPHAYGHTWSPGFEIEAGLLHGHAVAICMGLGAFLSQRAGWIGEDELHRILRLMSDYGLSLWHDILLDDAVMLESHRKIIQKRGQNLVAPVPRGAIGECGYLDNVTEDDLLAAVRDYRALCRDYPRDGAGIEPLCSDVGLEDPSTVTGPLVQD